MHATKSKGDAGNQEQVQGNRCALPTCTLQGGTAMAASSLLGCCDKISSMTQLAIPNSPKEAKYGPCGPPNTQHH